MAVVRPINLGGPRTTIGFGQLQLPPELRPQQKPPLEQDAMGASDANLAAALGRSAGASNTPTVESGSVIEALAAALEGGIHGRAAYRGAQQEENQLARALKLEDADRQSEGELRQAQIARLLAQSEEQPERWSDPYELGGAQVQRNEGTNQIRPVIQPNMSMMLPMPGMPVQGAAGYVWGEGGTQRPAPGGPADTRATREQEQRARGALSRLEDQGNVVAAIDRALELAGSGETGAIGAVMSNVPGTRAFDLNAQLDVIRANIGFEALNEMRANSPTGGALGQVTERELALLQSTMEALNQAQSREQFIAGLNRLKATYAQAMTRVRAAYEQDFGGGEGAPAQGGNEQRVLRWNPATGQLE